MSLWIPIVVAALGAGGPVMWFLSKFDRRNTGQHEENKAILERIEGKVDVVDQRLDGHIQWHLSHKE